MTTAIEVFMPALTLDQAKERWNILVHLREQVLQENTDYGVVPGTTKPTLLKPGAEKLCAQFGLTPRFELIDTIKDWSGTEHGEPLFYFEYKCRLYRGDLQVGEGDGSCNSWEKKYRYRKTNIVCPTCGQETIIKSKYPPKNAPRNTPPGWYCNTKSGGCGASFDADEPAIIQQPRGNVPNPDVFDQINTIKKMSQKRALIAAVLVATGASEFFTQDVEDLHISNSSQVVEGEVVETHTASYEPPRQEPRQEPRQRSRNGKKAPPAEQPAEASMMATGNEQQQLLGTLIAVQKELKQKGYKLMGDEPEKVTRDSPVEEIEHSLTFWTKRLGEFDEMKRVAAEIEAAAA